jgi:hypothetical protein
MRRRLGYNSRNSHFNSENLFHFGWLTLSSGGLWLIWVLTLAYSFSDGGFSCWYKLDCGYGFFFFVWVLMPMVGWGFANDGVSGVVSNFGGWALTIWVFGGGS